jgi:excisionase family DNA binding protein
MFMARVKLRTAPEAYMQSDAVAIDILEAAKRLSLSPRTVATLVARGELQSRKIGRRRIIPVTALEAFLRRDHPTGRNGSAL